MLKEAFKELAGQMHRADPGAGFALELWDGQVLAHGAEPKVVLRLKSRDCAKQIMAGGFLGFGEAYMAGDLEVEGELSQLLRLGLLVDFDRRDLALPQKLKFAALYLWHRGARGRATAQYRTDRARAARRRSLHRCAPPRLLRRSRAAVAPGCR